MTPDTTPYEEGDPSAPILLLGEAPSHDEFRTNRPFTGPAGRMLDLCLHSAQISRRDCYILNVFPERVKKGDRDDGKIYSLHGELLWQPNKGFTDAGRELAAPMLAKLQSSTANVIVPLGAPALSLALDPRPISKWRGSILLSPQNRKIVPTFHPAYVIHGAYEDRYVIRADLIKARLESTSSAFTPTTRRTIIDPSYDQCVQFLRRCLDAPLVNTDIEVLHGQVDCFSLSVDPAEAISIPIVDAGLEHRWSPAEELEIWRLYARVLQSPRIAKVNHTINFDLSALLQLNNLIPAGPLHDPAVAHSVVYPALKKSLAMLCSLYTRQEFYKDQGDLHDSHKVEDFARRWNYNALDSAISLESWLALEKLLDEESMRPTYDMTMQRAAALTYMMARGIRVDLAALEETRIKAQADLDAIVERLSGAFGRPILTEAPKRVAEKRAAAASGAINVNSSPQLLAYFYNEKRLKPYLNPIGRPTIDDKALARIYRRDGLPEAKLLQEYRKLSKLIGTYLEMQFDDDGRMRCSFNLRGTWTGRLSSSQTIFGNGGNLQNLPDAFAGFLVSDESCESDRPIKELCHAT